MEEVNSVPLSNIYLYKNNKLKLIPYLENVFIKNIFCCNYSINILLHYDDEEYNNKLIKLDNDKGYINISYGNNNNNYNNICGYYLTRDLLLYEFYCINHMDEHKYNDRYIKDNNICNKLKNKNYFYVYNIKPFLQYDKQNENVWHYDISKINKNEETNKYIKKRNMKYKNINTYYYGNNIFFGMNNINDICMWEEKEEHKKTKYIYYIPTNNKPEHKHSEYYYIYNHKYNNDNSYISSFVKYLHFPKKVCIESISCGKDHTLFLSRDKNCYAMGCNQFYQINYDKDKNKRKHFFEQPIIICITNKKKKKKDIKYIAAGYTHNLICTYKNELYGWGNNIYHQIWGNKQIVIKKPTLILNRKIIKNEICNNNKFGVLKICCGFSFSCILLKNKKCFLIGTYSNKHTIKKKKKKHHNNKSYHHHNNNNNDDTNYTYEKRPISLLQISKNKKIDDIYSTFYHIFLVENLKLSNMFPTIIHPQKKNKIVYLLFNFKIKKSLSYNIRLDNHSTKIIKKNEKNNIKRKKKCNTLQLNILPPHGDINNENKNNDNKNKNNDNKNKNNDNKNKNNDNIHNNNHNNVQLSFRFNYHSLKDTSNPLCLHKMFDVHTKKFKRIKHKHMLPYLINNNMINQKLYFTLYNNKSYIHFKNQYLMLSSYKGIIKNIIPNNCTLTKKIKIKLIINKPPIYIKKKFISILFYFKGHGRKEKIQLYKGKMNKNKKYIYTNIVLPTHNHNNKINTNNSDHHFNLCQIYFSLGYHFYKSSFPIIIIKPDILNITPNCVSINTYNHIYINMLHLSSNFHTIHVILYNTHLDCIYRKAYYDENTENYFFSLPLIPLTLFQKIKSEFIKFQVFASYNNVEYSQNDILLTVTRF
ncbi:CCAAT-box DNA binding protein subunit B [Plasmodium falciparum IGH-CR14]|uniref:CCAAT-box DNA binding protein subunit B n=1 Tax=Plasmodium falciparum IGH-CR14 TaxID=580059 RepID=A0A0L1I9V1_PLAFA|nr:CCAAT-box DNA binding protein subunit B [Plasmodium falciparum IGH-CR14]